MIASNQTKVLMRKMDVQGINTFTLLEVMEQDLDTRVLANVHVALVNPEPPNTETLYSKQRRVILIIIIRSITVD